MYDLIVVGGGFYGCMLALHEAKKGKSVCIIEKEADLMQRASYGNQAIVHRGYHYPRSKKTAVGSNKNYDRFNKEFGSCLYKGHKKYHAISKKASFVNKKDYQKFCDEVGSPCKKVTALKSPGISAVFRTPEYSFDSVKLKERIKHKLSLRGVHLKLNTEMVSFTNGVVVSNTSTPEGGCVNKTHTKHVALCTYADINTILMDMGLDPIDLKFQIAEMVLVDVPAKYKNIGLTVMDGPFFSITPFPSENCHVISHVKHSVHAEWETNGMAIFWDKDNVKSKFEYMQEAVSSYYPDLQMTYKRSIYEVKALLPVSCHDDGRPVLIQRPRHDVTVILGSKIDNVYDMLDYIDDQEANGKNIHEVSNQ
jgi:FAD dependent oxidoreductase